MKSIMSDYGYVPPAESHTKKDAVIASKEVTVQKSSSSRPKNNKTLLIIGIGCTLLLCCAVSAAGAYVAYNQFKGEDDDKKECLKEGTLVGVSTDEKTCCEGLSKIKPKQEADGESGICTAKCGNGTCDSATETNYNCPQDCTDECYSEGESIPVIPDAESCCSGLTLIKPKSADLLGSQGICTAKCGDGTCDSVTETNYNCSQDCAVSDEDGDENNGGTAAGCIGEGEFVPSSWDDVTQIKSCCDGLELILTKDMSFEPNLGICTAKCGNGVCDTGTESQYNCVEDCL